MSGEPTMAAYPARTWSRSRRRCFDARAWIRKTGTVATILIEGDLLGHTTHA